MSKDSSGKFFYYAASALALSELKSIQNATQEQAKHTEALAEQTSELVRHEKLRAEAELRRLEIEAGRESRERAKQQIKSTLFSLSETVNTIQKSKRAPLNNFILLQIVLEQLRNMPVKDVGDYADMTFHADVLDRAAVALSEAQDNAPSDIRAFEDIRRLCETVGTAASGLDAYCYQFHYLPFSRERDKLNNDMHQRKLQIQGKNTKAKSLGGLVGFAILILFDIVTVVDASRGTYSPGQYGFLIVTSLIGLIGFAVMLGIRNRRVSEVRALELQYARRKPAFEEEVSRIEATISSLSPTPCQNYLASRGLPAEGILRSCSNVPAAGIDFIHGLKQIKVILTNHPNINEYHFAFARRLADADIREAEAVVKRILRIFSPCPSCNTQLAFPIRASGKQMSCPRCKADVPVPVRTATGPITQVGGPVRPDEMTPLRM